MKIAIVIEKFHPTAGGNERSTHQIATRLIARGHQVTVLTSDAPKGDDLLPGGSVVQPRGPRFPTKFSLGLIQFIAWAQARLRRGGYDASLSMTTAVPAMVVQPRGGTVRETLARNLAMRSTALGRFTKQASVVFSPKQWAMLAAESRTLRHASVRKIVAISPYVADQLVTHYTVPPRRVALIPNAAEVRPLPRAERQTLREDLRQSLGLAADDIVFLFAAMNPALKGLGPLLESLAELRKTEPRARLIVAGTLRHGSADRLDRMGLRDAVKWMGPTRRMDALYVGSDVTVLPTWYDPSSKVVLESLLHGVPAISTLHNGASQWILDPTGRSTPPSPFDAAHSPQLPGAGAGRVIRGPGDVAGLTRAMLELCDPAERRRCSLATEGLDKLISMERHVADLEQVLIDAARAGASASALR